MSDDESDVDPNELAEELRLLQQDTAQIEDTALVEETPTTSSQELLPPDRSKSPQALLDLLGFEYSVDHVGVLREAFPLTSISTIEAQLTRHNKSLRKTFQALSKTNNPVLSFDELYDRVLITGLDQPLTQETSQEELLTEETEDNDVNNEFSIVDGHNPSRPLIEEIESIGLPAAESTRSPEPAVASKRNLLIQPVDEEDNETSSSGSSSDSDSDSDSSSEEQGVDSVSAPASGTSKSKIEVVSSSSDSDSDSDSSEDVAPVSKKLLRVQPDSSSDSSSDDSSSSDSDSDSASEPEEVSSKSKTPANISSKSVASSAPAALTAAAVPSLGTTSQSIDASVEPGLGMSRTRKRNARRREAKRRLLGLGDTQSQSPSASGSMAEESELLARKRALLSVVSEDVPDDTQASEPAASDAQPVSEGAKPEAIQAPDAALEVAGSAESSSSQRRMKVDMGAGRRLLFGALGLKNPKSKADEEKLRKNLMKNVKPLENPRVEIDEVKTKETETMLEQSDEDPDAWKEKITYRAVECCHDGMVLNEPPFPFVQRWDPQQQYGSMRKRKRASRNFLEDSYYDGDSNLHEEEVYSDNKKKKSKKRKSKGNEEHEETSQDAFDSRPDTGDADVVLNYDDIPAKSRPGSSQFADVDDLPSLPSDVSTLPNIAVSDLQPGMVITWSQLLLSKATNWQPQIASVTGLVLSVNDDDFLHVVLAKRDREQDDREYDEVTGRRVYAKFEAPDLNEDEEEGEDDGRREVAWDEITDPRLVQQAPLDKGTSLTKENAAQNGDSVTNKKVSTIKNRDKTLAEKLDTQEVRAGVEADPRELQTANRVSANDNQEPITPVEVSQQVEFMSSGRDTPISTLVRNADTLSDMGDGPSLQFRETVRVVTEHEHPLPPEVSGFAIGDDLDEVKDGQVDGMDVDLGEPENHVLETVIPDSMPSPVLPTLPSNNRLPDPRSGRQPSISGLGDVSKEQQVEESITTDTLPPIHETTPPPLNVQPRDVSPARSSPLQSLEEIFHTANTSRQTQSQSRSMQHSIPRYLKNRKHDMGYEEAMRKLDDAVKDSDRSPDRNKLIHSLFPETSQSSLLGSVPRPRSPEKKVPPTPLQSQKVKVESPFVIPEGSQVITLCSSPVSVQFTEHYAQDSEDETHQDIPPSQGSEMPKEKTSQSNTLSRVENVPANAVSGRTRLRSRASLPPARDAMASAFNQIRGRGRKSTRF